jgi:hypothetical protein
MPDEPDEELDPTEDPEEDETDEDEETEDGEAPATPAGRNFVDMPEGYVTPVGFVKILAKPTSEGGRNVIVKSQVIYSTAKNTKSFPHDKWVDGRMRIKVEDGLKWWDEKEKRKTERLAEATATPEPAETDEAANA